MELKDMAESLHALFVREGWAFGEYADPSLKDMEYILEQCQEHLRAQDVGTIIEVANVAIRKQEDNKFQVYIFAGEFNG